MKIQHFGGNLGAKFSSTRNLLYRKNLQLSVGELQLLSPLVPTTPLLVRILLQWETFTRFL